MCYKVSSSARRILKTKITFICCLSVFFPLSFVSPLNTICVLSCSLRLLYNVSIWRRRCFSTFEIYHRLRCEWSHFFEWRGAWIKWNGRDVVNFWIHRWHTSASNYCSACRSTQRGVCNGIAIFWLWFQIGWLWLVFGRRFLCICSRIIVAIVGIFCSCRIQKESTLTETTHQIRCTSI